MENTMVKSWELSDAFWDQVKGKIPKRERPSEKNYQRSTGGGRKPLEARQVLEGIFYVLRTGIQWKALPKEYGAASSVHAYFLEWTKAGFFEELWELGLWKYKELEGVGWEWQRAGGARKKVPLALPTMEKKRRHAKRQPDGNETPLSAITHKPDITSDPVQTAPKPSVSKPDSGALKLPVHTDSFAKTAGSL